jgi:phosphoribosylformimino-5-aminoimidazole carboxamide ribotide isomerase
LYASLSKAYGQLKIQASGGVSSVHDLVALKNSGADGAIVGKALYEGAFTVREALAAC